MASNQEEISVVQNLEKTVETGLHLDSLIPEQKDYKELPEGARPLFSISYEEVDLNGIEVVYQHGKDNVLPLKNFLLGRKKSEKNESVLSCYGVINDQNEVIYCLAVEPMLIEKLALSSAELHAKMSIRFLSPFCGIRQICFCFKNMTKFNQASGIGSKAITKKILKDASRSAMEQNRRMSFHLTVDISCMGARTAIAPKIDVEMSFCKLFSLPDSSKDVTIVAANKAEIKAHKIILMAQSPVFLSMFGTDTGMTEAKFGRILLEQKSEEGLTMFVRCLYGFPIPIETISPDLAVELFQLSHKYGVAELEMGIKNFLITKDVEWYTVDSFLELYFFAKNLQTFKDLTDHALIEMERLGMQSFNSSSYFKNLKPEDQRDLLLQLSDWKKVLF